MRTIRIQIVHVAHPSFYPPHIALDDKGCFERRRKIQNVDRLLGNLTDFSFGSIKTTLLVYIAAMKVFQFCLVMKLHYCVVEEDQQSRIQSPGSLRGKSSQFPSREGSRALVTRLECEGLRCCCEHNLLTAREQTCKNLFANLLQVVRVIVNYTILKGGAWGYSP